MDINHPKFFVLPKLSTADRALQSAEVGTIVYDTTLSKAFVCSTEAVGTDNWVEL